MMQNAAWSPSVCVALLKFTFIKKTKMGVGMTFLTSTEFALDNRQLSIDVYVHTTA